jgi:Cof subfamily protein (haloacid dehalogenase superfamily)
MNHLLVFDMDETLLDPMKNVTPENLAAIDRLRELDIGFTIATGRSHLMTGRYIDELHLDLPIIACNGGILASPKQRTVAWANPFQKELQTLLFRYLFDAGADFVAYTSDMVYYAENSVRVEAFRKYNLTASDRWQVPLQPVSRSSENELALDFVKILLYFPTDEQNSYLRGIPGLEVLSSGANFLDIMSEGSTKGAAVQALSRHLSIPVGNIAVFGDHENDISMFRSGALAVAMGNAQEIVKKEAHYITAPNTESGVAKAVFNYVLPRFGYTK